MAGAATAAYTADAWTSPGAVDGSQNHWDYAVPLRQSSTNHRSKSRSSHDSTNPRSRERNSKGSRSSSLSRHAYAQESPYLNSRGRREHGHSRRGSDTGSSRDIYGHESGSRSFGNVRDSSDDPLKSPSMKDGIGLYFDKVDNQNWIHRDKLAKIESEELQQAAILFQRRTGNEGSRSQRGGRNHGLHNSGVSSSVTTPQTEQMEAWPNLSDGQYATSPTSYDNRNTRDQWDLRRPEEIAADEENASNFYQNPALRKSSSRIPISSSRAPISPEHSGREFNQQRARGHTNEDEMSIGKPRRASEPMTFESLQGSSPPGPGSRPASRGVSAQHPGKKPSTRAASGSGTRKSSAPPATRRPAPRNRAASGNQRPTKPGETRPKQPVNRPEGDPPWLATMYKPDPRLPPDQQILPTHARKMQQEQWAKEDRTPTTYDREFAPLAIGPDAPPPVEEKPEKEEPQEQPPPPSPPPPIAKPESSMPQLSPRISEPNTRPSTGTGYSTMPRVQEPPPAGLTPKWSPPVVTAQDPPPKEKGCGCCIVM